MPRGGTRHFLTHVRTRPEEELLGGRLPNAGEVRPARHFVCAPAAGRDVQKLALGGRVVKVAVEPALEGLLLGGVAGANGGDGTVGGLVVVWLLPVSLACGE
jgi:hypothetical protein